MRCYVTLSNIFQLMYVYKDVIPVFTANKRWPVIRYVCVLLCCQ